MISRGKPSFEGEAPYVAPSESYTEFFNRVRGYKRLLQLINRDRDLTTHVLVGLGTSPLDLEVRRQLQSQLYLLAAKDKTPELLESMVMKAYTAATASAEAEKQVKIRALADANGLLTLPTAGQASGQPRGSQKLRPSDVKPGLERPAEGWGDSLEVIMRKVGTSPMTFAAFTQVPGATGCTPTPPAPSSELQTGLQLPQQICS